MSMAVGILLASLLLLDNPTDIILELIKKTVLMPDSQHRISCSSLLCRNGVSELSMSSEKGKCSLHTRQQRQDMSCTNKGKRTSPPSLVFCSNDLQTESTAISFPETAELLTAVINSNLKDFGKRKYVSLTCAAFSLEVLKGNRFFVFCLLVFLFILFPSPLYSL